MLSIQEIVRTNSLAFSAIALGVVILLLIFAYLKESSSGEKLKIFLFSTITIIVLLNTLYLTGSTLYINHKSVSDGPVHWHADFEIWNCGNQVNLKDPTGLSNSIGEPVVHEHNDNRIHIEGAILSMEEASLGYFFQAIGGNLQNNQAELLSPINKLVVPINDGYLTMKNGNNCLDNQPGHLQVFVYKTVNGVYTQQKLVDLPGYVISPQSQIPPGDCIIIEFDKLKGSTNKLCESYQVAEEGGKIKRGY